MERPDTSSPSQRVVAPKDIVAPMLTLDAHMDVPWLLTKYGRVALNKPYPNRMVDFPRMKKGKLDCAIFAMYLSENMQDSLGDLGVDHTLLWQETLVRSQKGCKIVATTAEAIAAHGEGLTPIFWCLEGGRLIHDDLDRLTIFREHGVRYLTLVHNRTTGWADSATDDAEHDGLTAFGREVIYACEELGIYVDISHSSDKTAEDVLGESEKPVIASHSGARAILNHPRNLSDRLIKAVARSGGVVCVPFARNFIGDKISRLANHIDHIVNLVGDAEHVGIGSDMDGAIMAEGAEDVSKWWDICTDNLGLRVDSLDNYIITKDVANILGGNMLRLLA